MSGDVFGNGMLRSEHIRLLAAFDHRHVFVDPDPDPVSSYAERRRLFELPRSSWDDYDRSLISTGGGVWPRSTKRIPISEQMRRALGITGERARTRRPLACSRSLGARGGLYASLREITLDALHAGYVGVDPVTTIA